MRDVSVFSVRDLRVNSSTLVREAEAGQVSIITKRGKPAVLALPFGSRLLEVGLDKDLALALFERRLITMAKAAKLAGVTQDAFMDLIAESGLVAVDYPIARCRSMSAEDAESRGTEAYRLSDRICAQLLTIAGERQP